MSRYCCALIGLLSSMTMLTSQSAFSQVEDRTLTTTTLIRDGQTTAPEVSGLDLVAGTSTITTSSVTATTSSVAQTGTVIDEMSPPERARWRRMLDVGISDDYREDLSSKPTYYRDLPETATVPLGGKKLSDLKDDQVRLIATKESTTVPLGKQPTGAMSGKILYVSAGHGWTNDNTSTTLWYTQRPITHGLIEDFGNLDQMNLFVDMCFRAGGTIVPMRPVGHQIVERVIDNSDENHARFYGEWRDSNSTVSHGLFHDSVPYRFAVASRTETAVARFQPRLPRSDYYPLYCWARDGADRVSQTYRIVHPGGATEVVIDHRRVGRGWVYLGEYFLAQGDDSYVEVTNVVEDESLADGKHVVIADAIRFGNGLGDVNRGGGISTRPREEEASRYWIERSLAYNVEPIYAATKNTDQNTNVGAPPRMAAQMNRETEGNYFDRLFLSFHSNAVGGRGVVGLYESSPDKRPDHQVEWAEMIANFINQEMTEGRQFSVPWNVRPELTDSHIDFGELRRDYINNEMVATIAEVAYHDNADDAVLLRNPSARTAMARACQRAALHYFKSFNTTDSLYATLPETPRVISAIADADGTVTLTWEAPQSHPVDGTSVTAYRVYHSTNGEAFDGGVVTTSPVGARYDNLSTGTAHYFRVAAVAPGGESGPSPVVAAGFYQSPDRALVIPAFSSVSEDTNLTQSIAANAWAPLLPGGDITRIIPRIMNPQNQAAEAGRALGSLMSDFDTVTLDGLGSSGLSLRNYRTVILLYGRQPEKEIHLSRDLVTSITSFVEGGGNFFVSGNEFAVAFGATGSTAKFTRDVLGIRSAQPTTHTITVTGANGKTFSTESWDLQLVRGSIPFTVRPVSKLELSRGAKVLLRLATPEKDPTGAVTRRREGFAAVLGFPFEALPTPEAQGEVMKVFLDSMGHEFGKVPPAKGAAGNTKRSTSSRRSRR